PDPNAPPTDFLDGPSEPPSPEESGWKDVFIAPPFKVTRILIRIAPQTTRESDLFPGKNAFPFDPTKGPGYVWHCHILDHEDNDMMRPMAIVKDLEPCLNCETMINTPGAINAGNTTPATTKPAHNHNVTTPIEQKGGTTGGSTGSTPMPMPMQPMK